MSVPIIGNSSAFPTLGTKSQKKKQKEFLEYQEEMGKKLREWEIENSCSVQAIIRTHQTNTQAGFMSQLTFVELDSEQLKIYINISEASNEKNIADQQV